jgi:hypothetical protein
MGQPAPNDSFRPEWLLLGFQVFARSHESEPVAALLHVDSGAESIDIYVRGGAGGTTISRDAIPYDVRISASPMEMLMFTSGLADPHRNDAVTIDGDADAASRIPALFDFSPPPTAADSIVALPASSAADPAAGGGLSGRAALATSARRVAQPNKKKAAPGGPVTTAFRRRNSGANGSSPTSATHRPTKPVTRKRSRSKGATRS